MNQLSDLLSFRIPPFYSLIVRTLTILEGLALSVDPDFRLIRGAYPFIAKQVTAPVFLYYTS
jgi:predicted unusual protein kinase regulating ubiquinone biosynthesis (AarF/ABC1/UbiB family)